MFSNNSDPNTKGFQGRLCAAPPARRPGAKTMSQPSGCPHEDGVFCCIAEFPNPSQDLSSPTDDQCGVAYSSHLEILGCSGGRPHALRQLRHLGGHHDLQQLGLEPDTILAKPQAIEACRCSPLGGRYLLSASATIRSLTINSGAELIIGDVAGLSLL